jgi:hypothetical protein
MGDSIDDCFTDHIMRDFVMDRGLNALGPGTNTAIELGHNEIYRHVYLLESIAFKDSVERYRALNLRAMKVHAPHLSARQELLGITAKKENCGIGGLFLMEQMEMGKNIG